MSKDLTQLKPRDLESYFRDLILKTFGNRVEDAADINTHSGSYYVAFEFNGLHCAYKFKKRNANEVARVIRALNPKRSK